MEAIPSPFIILILASLNEAIIEYLFGNLASLKPYLNLIGLTLSILLTFLFQISIFSFVGLQTNSPALDFLFTGIIISRISNFINDFSQKVLGSK